jgi:hypothetical protein
MKNNEKKRVAVLMKTRKKTRCFVVYIVQSISRILFKVFQEYCSALLQPIGANNIVDISYEKCGQQNMMVMMLMVVVMMMVMMMVVVMMMVEMMMMVMMMMVIVGFTSPPGQVLCHFHTE